MIVIRQVLGPLHLEETLAYLAFEILEDAKEEFQVLGDSVAKVLMKELASGREDWNGLKRVWMLHL